MIERVKFILILAAILPLNGWAHCGINRDALNSSQRERMKVWDSRVRNAGDNDVLEEAIKQLFEKAVNSHFCGELSLTADKHIDCILNGPGADYNERAKRFYERTGLGSTKSIEEKRDYLETRGWLRYLDSDVP